MKNALMSGAAALALLASAAAAEVSDGVVRIGVLGDRSGPFADLSGEGSEIAARMATEDFGGTVLGKPIEIVAADHQNKPDIASNVAREWFDVGEVDMITDLGNSSVALAVQELARGEGKVNIVAGAGTTKLTGDACSPTGFHWVWDTHSQSVGTAKAVLEGGGENWFFLTADYSFGYSLEEQVTKVLAEGGGTVVGKVRHPLNSADLSSFLLQAQASGASVVGLANAGADTATSIKQAAEFGLAQTGQKLASLLIFITDVDSIGLDQAQGLQLTTGFYWDQSEEARAFATRFEAEKGAKPTAIQAGIYSATLHYLKAVEAAGTDKGQAVAAAMRAAPVEDFFARGGTVQANGRMVYDLHLAEVKAPGESDGRWDYYKIVRSIPGREAFLTEAASGCAAVN
ncbi:MAG: ABC transporter substrate-binding protein [Pseudomonadota bacterium]